MPAGLVLSNVGAIARFHVVGRSRHVETAARSLRAGPIACVARFKSTESDAAVAPPAPLLLLSPPIPGQRKPITTNIVENDLYATLEAHRAANRAAVIRKISDDGSNAQTHYNPLKPPPEVEHPTNSTKVGNLNEESSTDRLQYDGAEAPRLAEENLHSEDDLALRIPKSVHITDALKKSTMEKENGRNVYPKGPWTMQLNANHFAAGKKVLLRPWKGLLNDTASSASQRLTHEILAFERYIRPTRTEEAAVEGCIAEVRSLIKGRLPQNPLALHGSRSTGLAGPLSDIDLCVSLPEFEKATLERGPSDSRPAARKAALKTLHTVSKILTKDSRFSHVRVVFARFTLVNARHKSTGLDLQILAHERVTSAKEYTLHYLSEIPDLRALYLLLRQALQIRELTTVFEGGLGSYPLLMMIVAALKRCDRRIKKDDTGGKLLFILDFWSKADLAGTGYTVDPPRTFPKYESKTFQSIKESIKLADDPYLRGIKVLVQENVRHKRQYSKADIKPSTRPPWVLCLQDPANPINDLGAKATQIKSVQAVFKHARANIISRLEKWIVRKTGEQIYLLDPLIAASYVEFERHRLKLRKASPGWDDDRNSHNLTSRMGKGWTSIAPQAAGDNDQVHPSLPHV